MPALLTPFDNDGGIDEVAHRHNLRFLSEQGADGFLIAGSTGEGPYLEPGDREVLVSAAREDVPDAFVLCGVNAESVRQASTHIAEAHAAGADAALVITPTSIIRGDHGVVEQFYLDVAEDAPLPIFLYTVPVVTGYELPLDKVRTLAAHPAIAGMKDSGGKVERVVELSGTLPQPFYLFVGASRIVAPALTAGAYGAITSSANYAFPIASELVAAALASGAGADPLQDRLAAVAAAIEPLGRTATKAAAALVGMRPGYPRRPLRPLSGEHVPAVAAALEDAGLSPEPVPAG
jgi:dihydrodipicolinate synthase/N-acetylneuraminate lyase